MTLSDFVLFSILSAMGGAAIRATVLAGIAALVIRLLRLRSAAAQHAVWTAVIAGMLVLPFAALVVPPIPVPSILHAPARIMTVQSPPPVRMQRPTPIRIDVNTFGVASISEKVSQPVTWWAALAAAVYGIGVLVFATRLAAGLFVTSRLTARAAVLRGTEANDALDAVANDRQMPFPRPSLYESTDLSAPALVSGQGLALLLPADWREWTAAKLRTVILHELAHAQRGDCLAMTLAAVNRVVFWFHPLAWWLQRRVAELCEQASDDAAVSATGDAAGYAQVLLEIAASTRRQGARLMPGAFAAPSMAGMSGVARRIQRVLDAEAFGAGVVGARRWFGLAGATAAVVGMLAAAQTTGEVKTTTGDVQASWKYIEEGFRVTAAQARELEMQVARQPEDLTARARLIAYYYYNARPEDMARHAQWVVEHRPESQLAASDLVVGAPASVGLADPSKAEAADHWAQLWLRQAALHDSDARVLGSAGRAVMNSDPAEGERLLLRALQVDASNGLPRQSLARLYAMSIYADLFVSAGITGFLGRGAAKPAFANHARSALETSTDTELIGLTGADLATYVLNVRESAKGLEAQFESARQQVADAARVLLTRALAAQPGREEWLRRVKGLDSGTWKMPLQVPSPPTVEVSPAAAPVSAVSPIKSAAPEYPALARQARIQGVVRFRLHVDSKGRVGKIEVMSGHPLLVPAATEAVRQYVYEATGAEFQTSADVNFMLPR